MVVFSDPFFGWEPAEEQYLKTREVMFGKSGATGGFLPKAGSHLEKVPILAL